MENKESINIRENVQTNHYRVPIIALKSSEIKDLENSHVPF